MISWKKAAIHYRALSRAQAIMIERQKKLLIWMLNQAATDAGLTLTTDPEINSKGGDS